MLEWLEERPVECERNSRERLPLHGQDETEATIAFEENLSIALENAIVCPVGGGHLGFLFPTPIPRRVQWGHSAPLGKNGNGEGWDGKEIGRRRSE